MPKKNDGPIVGQSILVNYTEEHDPHVGLRNKPIS